MDPIELTRLTVRDLLHEGHDEVRDAIRGLTAEALNWRPLDSANSIAALVSHICDAERFVVHTALDRRIERDRDARFRVTAEGPGSLLALIDAVESEVDALVAEIGPGDLTRTVARHRARTGVGWLLWAPVHSREHLGQIYLTRDLWLGQRSST